MRGDALTLRIRSRSSEDPGADHVSASVAVKRILASLCSVFNAVAATG
jgi:hypothetical protein